MRKASENFFESELRKSLRTAMVPGQIKEVGDSSVFFARLMDVYPARGSKIDWKSVPESIEQIEEDDSLQIERFLGFFDEIVQRNGLTGEVVYVGDSATDFALQAPLKIMREALSELLAIPQHHYLIGGESSWCMCFTMEGAMGFGFRP